MVADGRKILWKVLEDAAARMGDLREASVHRPTRSAYHSPSMEVSKALVPKADAQDGDRVQVKG
jgi:hypothetical protein